MPPDFLLRCSACGAEAVWDTEAIPPVGLPAPGHPVLWRCQVCGEERRHVIEDSVLVPEKLHHEICIATELDRDTVVRVMAELARRRHGRIASAVPGLPDDPLVAEAVAARLDLAIETVTEVLAAESAWLTRRGYLAELPS